MSRIEYIRIEIGGMTCASCVAHVERALHRLAGVEKAEVNLASETARVRFDASQLEPADILHGIEGSGYSARVASDGADQDEEGGQKVPTGLIVSVLLSLPLLGAMFAKFLAIEQLMFLHNPVLQLVLASPVQFWLGARFYRAAFLSLKAGAPGMDVLVVLGTSAAWGLSLFNAFFAENLGFPAGGLYFEASAIIITLVLLGRFLEEGARGKTSQALKKLMQLQPKTALVERDGKTQACPLDELVPGDHILLRPGDRVPVDGIVISGNSSLNESMVTGESLPVEKVEGDELISGSVNGQGALVFRAEKVGKDSMLSRIIAVVEEAQGSKAAIQRLVDKIAAVFVPVVLGVALLTLAFWIVLADSAAQGIISAVAVLVIACPCSLGLATPTAIMVGTGIAANRGILIKNAEVLQSTARVNTVVLDKTGTITHGKPALQNTIIRGKLTEDEALRLAASLEQNSNHPLAHALVRAAEARNLPLDEVTEFYDVPGRGVSARISGKKHYIGTMQFMRALGLNFSDFEDESLISGKANCEKKGATVVLLASEDQLLAMFAIADSIKEHSPEGVALLEKNGINVWMITGDNKNTAQVIADKVGISRVFSEVLPENKAIRVQELQKKGLRVAMVGDGINDAPALAVSDIGMAMGEGSDIAIESADITLMRGDLREIVAAIRLSERTMHKIRQNLFWAFFYNSIGIPLAAFGLLSPVIAGAAMAFSSVSVIMNSLALRNMRFK